ncbi:MAG: alpha/beta hydrolase family esterase [Paracoccaceae bacterium]
MRLLTTLLLCLLAAGAARAETVTMTVAHDGRERRALVDLPDEAEGAPVVLALHGGLAGPRTIRRKARMTLQNEGWIVAFPYAVDDWNDGRTDWRGRPHDDADDIGFLRKLVGRLAEAGLADPERVYAAGPSIGGIMALRLVCDAPDLVAGAAVAIASFADGYECAPGPARPVLFIHSTEDPLILPGGGRIGGWNPLVAERGDTMAVDETLAILAERNGCTGYRPEPLPDHDPTDGSTVVLRRYLGCGARLEHYIVEGGGHTWPGATPSRLGERIVGRTNRDISATRVVEAFFRDLANSRELQRAEAPASR